MNKRVQTEYNEILFNLDQANKIRPISFFVP